MAEGIGNLGTRFAQRQLERTQQALSSVFERLASGQRINKASDDAAGLAVASVLQSEARVFTQGVRNLNDGISLLTIADSALESLSDIATRIRELASQASNGSFTGVQRVALNEEAQALSQEYSRIVSTTKFNGVAVFSAALSSGLGIQAGYGTDGRILSTLGGAIGTGSFTNTFSSAAVGGTGTGYGVQLADLNGDGNPDAVSAFGTNYIHVALGNGDGTFGTAASYASPTNTAAITLADVDGDGDMDLVSGGFERVGVSLNSGTGSFGTMTTYYTGPLSSVSAFVINDFDDDGIQDVAVGLTDGGSTGAVQIFRSSGSGTLTMIHSIFGVGGGGAVDLAGGDLDGDGDYDFVLGGDTYASVITFDSTSGLTAGWNEVSDGYVSLGDVNGDGRLDLLLGNYTESQLRLGGGDGTFGAAQTFAAFGVPGDNTLADVNGDGLLDVVLNNNSSFLGIRLNLGNGSFGSEITTSTAVSKFTFADVNEDGVLDLMTRASDRLQTYLAQTTAGTSALTPFSLASRAEALQAITTLDNALEALTAQRGVIGGFQSRLSTAVNVTSASAEQRVIASSRIRDADIASDVASLVRYQVLQDAGTAVLAQAGQSRELVLQLLQAPT